MPKSKPYRFTMHAIAAAFLTTSLTAPLVAQAALPHLGLERDATNHALPDGWTLYAHSGQPIPGTPYTLAYAGPPVYSAPGVVYSHAAVDSPYATQLVPAIIRVDANGPSLVYVQGETDPGGIGTHFSLLDDLYASSGDCCAFYVHGLPGEAALLSGSSTQNLALLVHDPGPPTLPGLHLDAGSPDLKLLLTEGCEVIFEAQSTPLPPATQIESSLQLWSPSAGTQPILRTGEPLPNTMTFVSPYFWTPHFVGESTANEAGLVASLVFTRELFDWQTDVPACALVTPQTTHVFARAGELIPGTNLPIEYHLRPSLSPSGTVVLPLLTSNSSALARYAEVSGQMVGSLICQTGDPIFRGTAQAGFLKDPDQVQQVLDDGSIAFAGWDMTDTPCLFQKNPSGPLNLIVRTGDPVPDLPGRHFQPAFPYCFTPEGRILFASEVASNPSVFGFFTYSPADQEIRTLIYTHMPLLGSTVETFEVLPPGRNGFSSGFHSSGAFAFFYLLEDGRSGIIHVAP
ncbi:MAG: hypothetical protein R3F33_10440 [Planctomycetota bacterium]